MDSKQKLRDEMVARRAALSEKEVAEASARVMRNLFTDKDFLKAESAGFYYSVKGEIDTSEMIDMVLKFGKTVYLPKTSKGGIRFYEFDGNFEQLVKGQFGIMEPAEGKEGTPEIIVTPGLAFDMEKYRLGFGKGYYDKYFGKCGVPRIGICYEWQVVDRMPHEKWDIKMYRVITDQFVIE